MKVTVLLTTLLDYRAAYRGAAKDWRETLEDSLGAIVKVSDIDSHNDSLNVYRKIKAVEQKRPYQKKKKLICEITKL